MEVRCQEDINHISKSNPSKVSVRYLNLTTLTYKFNSVWTFHSYVYKYDTHKHTHIYTHIHTHTHTHTHIYIYKVCHFYQCTWHFRVYQYYAMQHNQPMYVALYLNDSIFKQYTYRWSWTYWSSGKVPMTCSLRNLTFSRKSLASPRQMWKLPLIDLDLNWEDHVLTLRSSSPVHCLLVQRAMHAFTSGLLW